MTMIIGEVMMDFEKITDQSVMPFGQYKGQKLAEVPDEYLLFLYENERAGRLTDYIKENLESIRKNAMAARRKKFDKKGRYNKYR